ncbi:hypothetical protein H9651_10570 [Microbacterium sp. Sa4CUA7]|uniref:Tfp pilus assembly protein PilO n=1 Tax=Microbacterium pullorum TaxID=2762236 RepID=A0ABR8S3M0_9MICO|nr:hypothetical protein [Microbacterium pullorum]MBD7958083.1 hypothetical protein [Microbacterium pullorum]
MNAPKQIVNLLGAVFVAGVVVAGVTLGALPLYGNAQANDESTRSVAQTNDIYDIQLQQLTADAVRIAEIDANVAALRAEIPARPQLDDLHEIVVGAAADVGARIVSVVAVEPVPWTARPSLGEQTAPAAPAVVDVNASDEEEAETDDAAAEPAPPPVPDAVSPQQQVRVTISVEVADTQQAAAFVDALGRGPRLIGVESAVVAGENNELTLTVTVQTFIRTEDPS